MKKFHFGNAVENAASTTLSIINQLDQHVFLIRVVRYDDDVLRMLSENHTDILRDIILHYKRIVADDESIG